MVQFQFFLLFLLCLLLLFLLRWLKLIPELNSYPLEDWLLYRMAGAGGAEFITLHVRFWFCLVAWSSLKKKFEEVSKWIADGESWLHQDVMDH